MSDEDMGTAVADGGSGNSKGGRPGGRQKPQKKCATGSTSSHQQNSNIHSGSGQQKQKQNQGPGKKKSKGSSRASSNKSSSNGGRQQQQQQKGRHQRRKQHRADNNNIVYPKYCNLDDCLKRYNAKDPLIIRGTIRVLPTRDGMSFCTCDRGSLVKDVLIEGPLERNRALHGDTIFVELSPPEEDGGSGQVLPEELQQYIKKGDNEKESLWQDSSIQMNLWAPVVPIQRRSVLPKVVDDEAEDVVQRRGKVIHVVKPKAMTSEIDPTKTTTTSYRNIVGTLKWLHNGTCLLTSSDKSLPQFRLSGTDAAKFKKELKMLEDEGLYIAKYEHGSWAEHFKWPPCYDVEQLGQSCNVEDETRALLIQYGVDHGKFPPEVLSSCQDVVSSGEYSNGTESGWKPTPEMYQKRRDYRKKRIFTIDPTTAKDLDDALHIDELDNGQIEIGVHIADVSYFVETDSPIDIEARRRCTTVYLVDRTIPMLPRPLCEIACSLNENVERLAFSCVWRMNRDGSLVQNHKVWYGRTVIKSCARLDYATAQNIIDRKVATGENEPDEELWPSSRRPTGGHTIDEVAADVRLMNAVAQARRAIRFQNGAIALNATKLTFQLDGDGETPLMCKPYEIRDSNRLVEEYMLLANYLVAQRLITHTGPLALLRHHEPPLPLGIEKVADMAMKTIGFQIDIESSEGLQRSLNRLGRECQDETVLKCITEMLKLPMRPANYIAAGDYPDNAWAHFALHIPYYTHFTSPIRRYADVIVHRLLQASIDGEEAVEEFPFTQKEIGIICGSCNEKKDASREAQSRSDEVFLALYLKKCPMKSQFGVVISVGEKTFTVFLPKLGVQALVYLDESKNWISFESFTVDSDRQIRLKRTTKHNGETWKEHMIKLFTNVRVTCKCSEKAPVKVKLELEGPWEED